MSEDRAKKTLTETPSARPKDLKEFGSSFVREVDAKVLPTAQDYLPLFRSKGASLSVGIHTDTTQTAEYTPEKEKGFLTALSQMMSRGEPGVCVVFPNAL
jgi:hypothetical protein